MAWDEARTWLSGTLNGNLYQNLLDDALTRPARNARRKKIIHPEDMPWEMARQGLLKHLLNEQNAHAHGDGRRLHAGDPAGVTVGQAPAPGGRVSLRGRGSRLRSAPGLRRGDHRHLSLAAAGGDQALRVGGGRRHL